MSTPQSVRCRQIGEADLARVADLLARGFPARPRHYWTRGLDRLAQREPPAGVPRFGYVLEDGSTAVGAILLIFSMVTVDGAPTLRCNLSSWYVEPAYRGHAAMLSIMPFRHKRATFINISAAPNTWATIEAQGFRRYTAGQVVSWPALARAERGLEILPFDPRADLPEAQLLADHAATGCLSLLGRGPEGLTPFVVMPVRIKQGRLPTPAMQLVYCRSIEAVVRFAAPLGRTLLKRGRPLLLVDANGPMPGLPGVFWQDRARRYAKGTSPPRLGDLAYTEFTIFGA